MLRSLFMRVLSDKALTTEMLPVVDNVSTLFELYIKHFKSCRFCQ